MRITKEQLRQIIKEELERVLEKYGHETFPKQVWPQVIEQLKAQGEDSKLWATMLDNFPTLAGKQNDISGYVSFGKGSLQEFIYRLASRVPFIKEKWGKYISYDPSGLVFEGSMQEFSKLKEQGIIPEFLTLGK